MDLSKKVVVISINGLRPGFYSDDSFHAPCLKRMAALGAASTGVLAVYPSLTYPCHTTLVTGVRPGVHRIICNTKFSWDLGPTQEWYWESRYIQVPTLWQAVKTAGKTTAAIRWPVTVGANIDWLIPEIFSLDHEIKSNVDLTIQHSTRGLMDEIFKEMRWPTSSGEKDLSYEGHDQWVEAAASHILQKYKPHLTLIHLVQIDKAQHDWGRDSDQVKQYVKNIDEIVNKIIHSITLFVKKGWISCDEVGKVKDWRVIAHVDGGQAAVYSKDQHLNQEILSLMKRNAGQIYRVLDRSMLDELGALPEAVCAIDPLGEFTIGNQLIGEWILQVERERGQHGSLPTRSGLESGLIAVGSGVRSNLRLGIVRLVDIAPTLAKLLKVELPDSEGRAISLN